MTLLSGIVVQCLNTGFIYFIKLTFLTKAILGGKIVRLI